LLSIASDAHSCDQLGFLENGVRQARRAWVTRNDALNARPLAELRSLLRRAMH
jgi:DNA polymerase (family 10)